MKSDYRQASNTPGVTLHIVSNKARLMFVFCIGVSEERRSFEVRYTKVRGSPAC
jgi:hypothetical protein